MKYGEFINQIQGSLPLWVLATGDYLAAALLLLLGIVLFSSFAALILDR